VPDATQAALEAWLPVQPLARGRGLRDEQALFVRLGPFLGAQPPEPLSGQAVHKLVRICALAVGVPQRLAHLHALRTYWATSLLEDAVPIHRIHRVSSRLGDADLRTTSRYAADHPDQVADVADVLDRRHPAIRRARR
jgi:site-specific recombinase XerD